MPAAAIKDVGTAVEHPQLRARDRWRTVDTEHAAVEALLPPATFADFEAPMGAVPALGADTRTVLASMGCSPDEIDALVADGVVGD